MELTLSNLRVTRRDLLKASGAAAICGTSLTSFAQSRPAQSRRAERMIVVWCAGGLSQLESWDPKPGNPSQGECTPIASSVPGIEISESFPKLSQQLHRCTIIRSIVGDDDRHLAATQLMLSGPSLADGRQPASVSPFRRDQWAADGNSNSFASLGLQAPLPNHIAREHVALFGRADLHATLDRYGDTHFGRSMLFARHLIETGTRYVQVHRGGFDTHANNFQTMRTHGEVMDKALASLLDDLAASGLLETTLVAVLSEFGRSPRINAYAGRDHWVECFSVLLAGAGMPAGRVIGATDRSGYRAVESPLTVSALHSRIRSYAGITESTGRTNERLADRA